MAFDKLATRENAKLRLSLTGPAGVGKTHGALLFASVFGKRIGLMDSERGSAKKVVGLPGIPTFFHEILEEKNVDDYTAKIQEAADASVDCLVIDSFSHSWISALETVDRMGGNKFTNGWKVVSPKVTRLVDAILAYPGHVIATMRSKSEYVTETVNGKAVPRKVGLGTVSRDGTDFEFDVMLELGVGGTINVGKTRCNALDGCQFMREDIPKIAEKLRSWLAEGAPLTAVDLMLDRIKFAKDEGALRALVDVVKAMPIEDRKRIESVWKARRQELSTVTP